MSLTVTQNDYTQINFNDAVSLAIASDPNFTAVAGTNIRFNQADRATPAGVWVVGDNKATAAGIVLAKFYQGFLSANGMIQTQMTAMSVNTQFANASAKFAEEIKLNANAISNAVGSYKTYADLVSMARNYVNGLNMTAEEFVAQVLPTVSKTANFESADLLSIANTVDQYSNSKLTDNSVLQQKLDTANANRASIIEAMSAIIKTWGDFLNNLAKGV